MTTRRHHWYTVPAGEYVGRTELADGRNYWLELDVKDRATRVVLTGYYEDIYVQTVNGWCIKQRHARRDPQ